MNFLTETLKAIKDSQHSVDDIVFIGSELSGHQCTWSEFEKLANREYTLEVGAKRVAQDLIIVFSDDLKMWRAEYDGSEWWEYSAPFVLPKNRRPITELFSNYAGLEDLRDINEK